MPALGKSGTCRILSLSASINPLETWAGVGQAAWSANSESGGAAGRRERFHGDVIDAGAAGATPQLGLGAVDRLGVPFEQHFDLPVRQVRHPAVQALDRRLRLGEGAKAHALDPPANQIPPRDAHVSGDYVTEGCDDRLWALGFR